MGINISLDVNLGPVVRLQGAGLLEVNTGSQTYTRGAISVAPNTLFNLNIAGSLNLFDGVLTLDGSLGLSIREDGIRLAIDATLKMPLITAAAIGSSGNS